MLTDILHVRGLRKQLVNLVADIQLFVRLEVSPRQLLPHSRQHLHRPLVLGLSGFLRHPFLGIEDPAFQNGRSSMARVIARLDSMFEVHLGLGRLTSFGSEWHPVGRLADSETPVDQGIVDELDMLARCWSTFQDILTASRTAIRESLFSLRTRITASHVIR